MNTETALHHVALHCSNKNKADLFFKEILGMQMVKSFTISSDLTYSIFGINNPVDIGVGYDPDRICCGLGPFRSGTQTD